MKINWNEKYNTIGVYSLIVLVLSIVFYLIASEVNLFKIQVSRYMSVFQPFIIGFVMAYLFNFILEFFEDYILRPIFPKWKKVNRIVGIFLTYIVVFLFLYLFLNFILPQLVTSLMGLVNDIPEYFKNTSEFINNFLSQFAIPNEYYELVMGKWNEFVDYTINFATNLIPKLGNLTKSILSSIWNILLGIIISIYLLIDKDNFKALTKKITVSIFSTENANRIMELTRRGDNIFGKFLSGKILDSFIIAILTFVILKIAKMPYQVLISFIIGVTNIIPFFGPFIGAIPSFFIILFVSPIKALWFLFIVLIIQQIDGNIIGPKILGDSLGISAFWILFALLIAGKLLGFIGLIIGVPLFVFIYSIIKDIVEARLERRGLPKDTEDYL